MGENDNNNQRHDGIISSLLGNPLRGARSSFGSDEIVTNGGEEDDYRQSDPLAAASSSCSSSAAPLLSNTNHNQKGDSTTTSEQQQQQQQQQRTSYYHPRTTSRVGNSCRFVLVGLALCVGALAMLGHNEMDAVQTHKFYQHTLRQVQEYNNNNKDKTMSLFQPLLHVTAWAVTTADTTTSSGSVADETFGVYPANNNNSNNNPLLKLYRITQMYQWVESEKINKDGYFTYTQEWSADWQNSNDFVEENHPQNPNSMPYESKIWDAASVIVTMNGDDDNDNNQNNNNNNALTLSADIVQRMNFWQAYESSTIRTTDIPDENLRQRASVVQHEKNEEGAVLYIRKEDDDDNSDGDGRDPATQPQIGDLRIRYRAVPPQVISVVATLDQDQKTLIPYSQPGRKKNKSSPRPKIWVQPGHYSAAEMLRRSEGQDSRHLRVLRWTCTILVFLGLLVLTKPASVLQDAVPAVRDVVTSRWMLVHMLVLSVMITWSTIALCWLLARPILSLLWFTAQGAAVHRWGCHMEWWGGMSNNFSTAKASTARADEGMNYQLVEEQTFMELNEVQGYAGTETEPNDLVPGSHGIV